MLYEKIRKIFFKGMKLQLSVEVKDTFHYLHEIKIKNKKKKVFHSAKKVLHDCIE